jgi:cytochrome c5
MNRPWKYFLPTIALLATIPLIAQTVKSSTAPQLSKQAGDRAAHTTKEHDGQQVWEQNCSRCHNAPQGFSPRISGTIVRHMRVRAGLSKQDEQALMRFLNP